MNLSIEEMQGDMDATIRDIACLERIVGNLNTFVSQPHGEDRSFFRVDIVKYDALLRQGKRLRDKIQRAMDSKILSS